MRLALFTVPIVALKDADPSGHLVGLGSGCLVRSGGRNVLIGVRHVFEGSAASYAIHIRNDIGLGSELYRFDPTIVERLGNMPPSPSGVSLDFFVEALPDDVRPQEHTSNASGVLNGAQDRLVFAFTQIAAPNKRDFYGFCGLTRPVSAPDYVETERMIEEGLRFEREDGARLVFKLSHEHPGHDPYEGCSGAPIVSQDEELVSLLIGGRVSSNEVFGLHLGQYKSAIVAESLSYEPNNPSSTAKS